jgi:hypothetical protein
MVTIKRLLGCLLLVLAAGVPLGCGSSDDRGGVRVGGDDGVVIDHGVSVGGEKGVVIDHGVSIGGEHGVNIGHDRD